MTRHARQLGFFTGDPERGNAPQKSTPCRPRAPTSGRVLYFCWIWLKNKGQGEQGENTVRYYSGTLLPESVHRRLKFPVCSPLTDLPNADKRQKPADRGIAQPGSASGLGPEGRKFESCCPDHFSSTSRCQRTQSAVFVGAWGRALPLRTGFVTETGRLFKNAVAESIVSVSFAINLQKIFVNYASNQLF